MSTRTEEVIHNFKHASSQVMSVTGYKRLPYAAGHDAVLLRDGPRLHTMAEELNGRQRAVRS
jgi:hypothetical protein